VRIVPRRPIVPIVIALAVGATATHVRADDTKIALFDLRPVTSKGQTDLNLLQEAVRMSTTLRERLATATGAAVVEPVELKSILGPLYRVNAFACREAPRCLQRTMVKLSKQGIARVILGTYEVTGNRAQLTLHGVETRSGAFTKVELFEVVRGGEIDEADADRVLVSVADLRDAAAEPEPEPDPGGDQTDVLFPEPPPPPPPVPDRILLLGWGRSHTSAGRAPPAGDVLDPPYDQITSNNALYIATRFQRGKRFEASASGLLAWTAYDDRTAYEATVRELYVGVASETAGIRIGNQRIAWGKGDAISPNDVLNPADLRDPLLTDPELRRIPSFAARGDVESGSHALQLVLQPIFVPDRVEVFGSNWALIQPSSPEPYRGLFRVIAQLFDDSSYDQAQQLFARTELPTRPSAGGRYTFTGRNFDASLYYHFGYHRTPEVTLDPMFAGAIMSIDWRTATPSMLAPVLDLLDAGIAPFAATFRRRHHVGVDAVTTVGSIAFKLDAAFDTRRVFYQPDLLSFTAPAAQAVVSVEYQSGELGKLVLVEGIYNRIIDPLPAIGLIGYQRDTLGAAGVVRWTFFDRIEADVRAVFLVSPRTTIVQPQLAYRARSGAITVAVGASLIEGEAPSLGDYFDRNDRLYALVKYAF
jgi:hypothetical protein